MQIFSKYENLSSEKTLVQQFNSLSQEMDLLKLQLNKVNQLLNDTISEKCKQELMFNQQQQQQNYMSFNSKSDNGNLFRASLVPVGAQGNSLINDTKSVSSIWKLNSPQKHSHAPNLANGVQFNSIDNLADDYSNKQRCNNNYAQLETPRSRQQQYRSSLYNPNHHYYYLNADTSSNKSKLDNNISKSIDGLYTAANPNLANSFLNETTNGQAKKTALLDVNDDYKELPVSFQPVNFTSNRPKQNSDYSVSFTQSLNLNNSIYIILFLFINRNKTRLCNRRPQPRL